MRDWTKAHKIVENVFGFLYTVNGSPTSIHFLQNRPCFNHKFETKLERNIFVARIFLVSVLKSNVSLGYWTSL